MKKDVLRFILAYIGFLACVSTAWAGTDSRAISFDKGWKFTLGDDTRYSAFDFRDSSWRSLDLPHDWAIEGSFSKDNPSGTGGGALPGGIGWYRKSAGCGRK